MNKSNELDSKETWKKVKSIDFFVFTCERVKKRTKRVFSQYLEEIIQVISPLFNELLVFTL